MNHPPCIVVGAGGHARVLIKTLQRLNMQITGLVDAAPALKGQVVCGFPVLGSDDALDAQDRKICLVNGIGSTRTMALHRDVYDRLRQKDFRFASVVHPAAFCDDDVRLGEGVQIMAGAILQTGCRIGENTIINTGAIIDHDCSVGAHCHIGPGAVLSGCVQIGDGTHVGVGATIIQNMKIGEGCLIAAGSVVVEPVLSSTRVGGVPARVL